MISQRHLARVVVMQALFAFFTRPNTDLKSNLDHAISVFPVKLKKDFFAIELAEGSLENKKKIEKNIALHTKNKTLEKIDFLTLAILFISTFEMCFSGNKLPIPIIINEAVELAKEYGKDTSPALVNAVLSSMANNLK